MIVTLSLCYICILTYFPRVVASTAYHRYDIDPNTQICQAMFHGSQRSVVGCVTSFTVSMVRKG
jgi:hypothetical protein